jgi:uracil-DNA glycosylase
MSLKIAIVGESWGQQEVIYKRPFVGAAGDELTRQLGEAGILTGPKESWYKQRGEVVYLTNVFNFRPSENSNEIEELCCKKKELPKDYAYPMLKQNHYVKPEHLWVLDRLKRELEELKPNIVIALGNTACWALLHKTGIDKLRGAITPCVLVPGLKVLPTYHPSFILRGRYDRRPMTIMDLAKAKQHAEFGEIRRIPRTLWLEPSIADLEEFEHRFLEPCEQFAFDIENPKDEADGQISCISFATSFDCGIVVPFFDRRRAAYSYWATQAEEIAAWRWVKRQLESPKLKVGQNGIYDIAHLALARCRVRNYSDDTMLLHHSLQPEEKKGLGVLGSLYSDERAWKTDFKRKADSKSIKRDD